MIREKSDEEEVKMKAEIKSKIDKAVERMYAVQNSKSTNYMVLFELSGLSKDFLRGKTIEGADLCDADLSELDLTGTKFTNSKKNKNTIFSDSFDLKTSNLMEVKDSNDFDVDLASIQEIETANMFASNGIHLGKIANRYLINDEQKHILVVGAATSGKSEGFIIPNLLKLEGSSICLDLNAKYFTVCARELESKGNKVYLFNPGEYGSHCYNPLDYVSENPAQRIIDLRVLADTLIPIGNESESYWIDRSRELLVGVISFVLESRKFEYNRTLGQVMRVFNASINIEGFLMWLASGDEISAFTKQSLRVFNDTAEREAISIKSIVANALRIWEDPFVEAVTSLSDFDLRDLKKTKMNIFIGAKSGEKSSLYPLLNLFFNQAKNALCEKRNKDDETYEVLFMIDEIYSQCILRIVRDMVQYSSISNVRLALLIRSISELNKNEAFDRGIKLENFDIKSFLSLDDQMTENYVRNVLKSKSILTKIPLKEENGDTMKNVIGDIGSKTVSSVVSFQELKNLTPLKQVLMVGSTAPILSSKVSYLDDEKFKGFVNLKDRISLPAVRENIKNYIISKLIEDFTRVNKLKKDE